jgi:hypothetical protein
MESYSISGTLGYAGFLPEEVEIIDGKISGQLGQRQADIRKWNVPPHVEFANLPLGPKILTDFLRQYGVFEVSVRYRDDMIGWGEDGIVGPHVPTQSPSEALNLGHIQLVKQGFAITIQELVEAQTRLRFAWRGDRTVLLQLQQSIKRGEFLVASPISDEPDLLTTRDLWGFICYVFLLDYSDGKAKICAFRDCTTPYFVKVRTDQMYCSHSCAVKDNNLRRAQASKGKSSRRRTQ